MIRLRAHHGMCLYYFKGKGYSNSFVANILRYKELLENDDPTIDLTTATDDLCSECPHNHEQICASAGKVLNYDKCVLDFCNLHVGDRISYRNFSTLVEKRIVEPGNRPGICGDCQWSDLCV